MVVMRSRRELAKRADVTASVQVDTDVFHAEKGWPEFSRKRLAEKFRPL